MHRNWSLFEYNETPFYDVWHGVYVAGGDCVDGSRFGVGCVSLCAGARANDFGIFDVDVVWE